MSTIPMRVDICGGWLDLPRYADVNGYIVNVAVTPGIDAHDWHHGGGMGGSAAAAVKRGEDAVQAELDKGVGWQDPAVILETGWCVWRPGKMPDLVSKDRGLFAWGRMAVEWTGQPHCTASLAKREPDIEAIAAVSREFVDKWRMKPQWIAKAINATYAIQRRSGMEPLRRYGMAVKYCGSGFGGYALHFFPRVEERAMAVREYGLIPIEPYMEGCELP